MNKKKKSAIEKVLRDWSLQATFHCYPKLFQNYSLLARIFWFSCFLAFAGLTAFFVFMALTQFFEYETVSKIEIITEKPSPFPTVTLCDNNPFTSKEAETLMLQIKNEFGIKNDDEKLILLTKILVSSDQYNDTTRQSLGSLFFENSTFDKKYLKKHEEFNYFYSFEYGNCWQFNSNFESKTIKIPGKTHGLSINGFVENNNKIITSYSSGLVVFIHNRTLPPTYFDDPILIETGKETNLIIERVFTKNEPSPYSRCLNSFPSELGQFLVIRLNRTYRQKDCLDMCMQRALIKECGCYFNGLPFFSPSEPCFNASEIQCLTKTREHFNDDYLEECEKECPQECEYVTYEYSLSSLVYPSRTAFDNLIGEEYKFNYTYEMFKESFFYLHIFYKSLDYTQITQFPKTVPIELFSNLGGLIGIFLGFSIFSFIEIVEILLRIVWIIFQLNT